MKEKAIDIGIKIDLPSLLETKLLLEADSGSGKSWTIRKLAEECSGMVQQIIIDPEGEFVTLREKYPFALVSKNGDLPLSIRYAEALAHKILETGISTIIDLYEFKQHEREQFVKTFIEALMNAPKNMRHSCLIYIDEAQLFCPEDKRAISTAAVIDLCTRGRKRGLCAILATLRISILNKSAAAQCKNKLMGSTSLPLDQKRVGDELGLRTKEEIRDLRNLDKGEFYAFGPAISKEIIKFRVGEVKTTHIKSGTKVVSMPPTPSAIKKILSKLESIPEEAEKEITTKQGYKNEISRLKAELKKSGIVQVTKNAQPISDRQLQKQYDNAVKELSSKNSEFINERAKVNHLKLSLNAERKYSSALVSEINAALKSMVDLKSIIDKHFNHKIPTSVLAVKPEISKSEFVTEIMSQDQRLAAKTLPVLKKPIIIADTENAYKTNGDSAGAALDAKRMTKSSGVIRMLYAAGIYYPDAITRIRMGTIADMSSTSGTFGTHLSTLSSNGLIDKVNGDVVCTELGWKHLQEMNNVPSRPDDWVSFWIEIFGESSGPGKMLRFIDRQHPNSVTREEIGAAVGMSHTSGTFGTYFSKLRSNDLIFVNKNVVGIATQL